MRLGGVAPPPSPKVWGGAQNTVHSIKFLYIQFSTIFSEQTNEYVLSNRSCKIRPQTEGTDRFAGIGSSVRT
jgi:hypothetical protein